MCCRITNIANTGNHRPMEGTPSQSSVAVQTVEPDVLPRVAGSLATSLHWPSHSSLVEPSCRVPDSHHDLLVFDLEMRGDTLGIRSRRPRSAGEEAAHK